MAEVKYLKDYQAPNFSIDSVDLYINLFEEETIVTATMQVKRNGDHNKPLFLHGEELVLQEMQINNETCENYEINHQGLTIANVPNSFNLIIKNIIYPQKNTKLEGLYKSGDIFCTQCEPEGFRKITYFLDRPDVLARYTTTIEADKNCYPILLSNGNCIAQGDKENTRHWVKWEDPFLKPSYLFALVAGKLDKIEKTYITNSNRQILLQIYTDPGYADHCHFAMESLEKAMRWDEERFGRECDLDQYMIVAVKNFNMGAMENKGLNIFNAKYILADTQTATDDDYLGIESVVAHEYFHNWTGNRITCRDWFQLSLKEGLTVFRDQEFSADMQGAAVQRIQDVQGLLLHQFPEDQGPLAHPVQPDSYIEINNFYTATVYEKGAEIVRILYNFLGKANFRKGMDLYFERFDGQAVTIEDFIAALADANNTDLSKFLGWYKQSGTPKVIVKKDNNHLIFQQENPETPDQAYKHPLPIPIKYTLIDKNTGQDSFAEKTFLLTKEEETIVIDTKNTLPSLLRNFSAPVELIFDYSNEDLAFLMVNESDDFNRWQAAQRLYLRAIKTLVEDIYNDKVLEIVITSVNKLLENLPQDQRIAALSLTLPSISYIIEQYETIPLQAIYQAKDKLKNSLALHFKQKWQAIYNDLLNQETIGARKLKNLALSYLMALQDNTINQLCFQQFKTAKTMTDAQAALTYLVYEQAEEKTQALEIFYQKWHENALVLDKWFAIQASTPKENNLEIIHALLQHQDFISTNPNRVRSVLGAFVRNFIVLHREDGQGYNLFIDNIIILEKQNPQIASRLLKALSNWRKFDTKAKPLLEQKLGFMQTIEDLSPDVSEVIGKILK